MHSAYPPLIADLLVPRPLALGPGTPNHAMRAVLHALTPATLIPTHRDRAAATACLSGLWLYHDFLDESHTLSQDLPDADGSYWHAIMHRREPDASNSKYWFRKVGHHPVLAQLVAQAPASGYGYTDAFAFVDWCERVRGSGSAAEALAERVQQLEWEWLFAHCYRRALGA
jgi:hypothetical protein